MLLVQPRLSLFHVNSQSLHLHAWQLPRKALEEGFSEEVAQRVARGKLRGSSWNVYEGIWKIFAEWCAKRKSDPWQSSIQLIAEFLLHLFEGKKHKVKTIEGYRAAIAASLKLRGLSVGTCPYLSSLIASFYVDCPVEQN